MFKKYKIKKRKKSINPWFIFIILIILTLFMSYGYAYLSDSLIIIGKANILYSDEGNDESDEEVVER